MTGTWHTQSSRLDNTGNWFFRSVVGQSGVVGFGEPPTHVAELSPDPRLDHEVIKSSSTWVIFRAI